MQPDDDIDEIQIDPYKCLVGLYPVGQYNCTIRGYNTKLP